MNSVFKTLLAAGLLAATASAAAAATVSYTYTIPSQTTDFSANGFVSAFNIHLGTLTAVDFGYTFQADYSGNVTNTAPTTQGFKISEETDPTFTFGAISLSDFVKASQSYTLASGATALFGPYSAVTSGTGSDVAANFAAYEAGPVAVSLSTLTGTTIRGGGGNIITNINTFGQGSATITYTYTPAIAGVPEPASWAMMLTGFGFAGVALRRRRAVAAA